MRGTSPCQGEELEISVTKFSIFTKLILLNTGFLSTLVFTPPLAKVSLPVGRQGGEERDGGVRIEVTRNIIKK